MVFVLIVGLSWAGSVSAEHGQPSDDDAHVPLIIAGPGVKPGRYSRRVSVVDLAPTLARLLGVQPLEKLDGRVLTEALRQFECQHLPGTVVDFAP
jgi:arylsulfatase A-like enzyme